MVAKMSKIYVVECSAINRNFYLTKEKEALKLKELLEENFNCKTHFKEEEMIREHHFPQLINDKKWQDMVALSEIPKTWEEVDGWNFKTYREVSIWKNKEENEYFLGITNCYGGNLWGRKIEKDELKKAEKIVDNFNEFNIDDSLKDLFEFFYSGKEYLCFFYPEMYESWNEEYDDVDIEVIERYEEFTLDEIKLRCVFGDKK